jgi:FkbM family methyltransferase
VIETREQVLEYAAKHTYDHLPGKDPNTFVPFPGARVLDIGANLGIVTAFWALNGAQVTSYEADPETFEIMTAMFSKLGIRVDAVNKAVWTKMGSVNFKGIGHMDGGRPCRNGQIESVPGSISVPCVTLARALGDTIWDCVKIDIEGAEFDVLMSTDSESLKNVKYMHLELHETRFNPNGMTPTQVAALREKMESVFNISDSIYPGFWHLKNKETL